MKDKDKLAPSSQQLLLKHFVEKGIFSKMHVLPEASKVQAKVGNSAKSLSRKNSKARTGTNQADKRNEDIIQEMKQSADSSSFDTFGHEAELASKQMNGQKPSHLQKLHSELQNNISFSNNNLSFVESKYGGGGIGLVLDNENLLRSSIQDTLRGSINSTPQEKNHQPSYIPPQLLQQEVSSEHAQRKRTPRRPESSANVHSLQIPKQKGQGLNTSRKQLRQSFDDQGHQRSRASAGNTSVHSSKSKLTETQSNKIKIPQKQKQSQKGLLMSEQTLSKKKHIPIVPTTQNVVSTSNIDQNIKKALQELSPSRIPHKIISNLQSQINNNIIFQRPAQSARSRSPELIQNKSGDSRQYMNAQSTRLELDKAAFLMDQSQSMHQLVTRQGIGHASQASEDQSVWRKENNQIISQSQATLQSQVMTSQPIDMQSQKIIQELQKQLLLSQQQLQVSHKQYLQQLEQLNSLNDQNRILSEQIAQMQNGMKMLKGKLSASEALTEKLKVENESIKTTSIDQMTRFENVIKRFQVIDEEVQKERRENEQLKFEYHEKQVHLDMSVAHIQSLVAVMTDLLEYVITRCQITQPGPSVSQSRNQSQSQNQIDQYSYSEDFLDRSYDDERRSLVEQIKTLLVAKIDAIQKSLTCIDLQKELNSIKNWKIVEPPQAYLAMNSYDTNHNSAASRKDSNLFAHQQQQLTQQPPSRNTFKNFNSNNTVNFLGVQGGGSLYNGTLGAQSNSSDQVESDATPIPSFGKISARDDKSSNRTSEQNKQMNKALTFSESKFIVDKKFAQSLRI